MEELAAARDSDELSRLLVQSPWGWGSSTRHGEAVSLLRRLRGGTLPGSLVALLLCTCRRWDRVTAKLIAAVEECGVLSGPELDELAESLLSDEVIVVFPLAWVSGQCWSSAPLMARHGRCRSVMRRWRATSAGWSRRCAGGPLPGRYGTILRGLRSCSRVPMAWRRVIVTRCCMACSMPRTGWMRAGAACWWAGHCAAESPGFAGPLWTGCVNSTGRERRCATPGRTLIGRCALGGARPARLHQRRRSCRALRHRSRKGPRSCAGWLVVMCGAAILLAAKLRRLCNGCSSWMTRSTGPPANTSRPRPEPCCPASGADHEAHPKQ
jgi:hypothetical protein